MTFASKTVTEHVVRGLVGLGAIAVALAYAEESLLWPVLLLPIAFLALRGCPTCWMLGLVETFAQRRTGAASSTCVDGACLRAERVIPRQS